MNKKDKIIKYATALLNSANTRKTKQGVIVYTTILEELNCGNDIESILNKLNKALIGIEAHGDLTNDEFSYVKKLRKLSK